MDYQEYERTNGQDHPETDHRGLSGVRKDESSQLEDTVRLVWAQILKVDPEGFTPTRTSSRKLAHLSQNALWVEIERDFYSLII